MLDRHAVARVAPFLAYMVCIVLADMMGRAGCSDAQLRWLYPVKIAIVIALLWHFRYCYEELRRPLPSAVWQVTSACVGLLVFVLWISLHAQWMVVGTSAGFDPRTNGVIELPLAVARLAGAALVVPVMEELFWRSFLLRWISALHFLAAAPGRTPWTSAVMVSVLFGVEHNLWLAGIVAGFAYTILYMRSATLWTAIIAHAVTNGSLGVWVMVTGRWSYW